MMSAIRDLLHEIPDPNLSNNERVRLRCQLAKQFEKTGNYEAACGALDDLWTGLGKHPNLDKLDQSTAGEVLLRVGVLTGQIGDIRVIKGSQQIARSLMNESIAIFEVLKDDKKVAEAQTEIALCFMREGSLEMARSLSVEALTRLDDRDGDLKALAILRSTIVEILANRQNNALNMLTAAVSLFESSNPTLRGCFHNQLAMVLQSIGAGDSRQDYIDSVLQEFTAASFYFKQVGHVRYQGMVENNTAFLFLELERFAEAHEHLDRAQVLYTSLSDSVRLAQLEDTRARVLLGEGAILKANKILDAAISILERGDHPSLLAETLTTRGITLSRLQRYEEARAAFERAIVLAKRAGEFDKAGIAALTLIEQLIELLNEEELCSTFERARGFLEFTQNTVTLHRLSECASRVLSKIYTAQPDWATFSLGEALHRHEGRFIQMALAEADGSVTKAAALLGLAGHQSLNFILNRRHPELLNSRTPIKPRRRSSFKLITPQKKVAGGDMVNNKDL